MEPEATTALTTLSLSINDRALTDLKTQNTQLNKFIRSELKQDIDFGVFPGTNKPSLFKPGAEKLAKIFQLGSRIVSRHHELDIKNNWAWFSYTVEIYHLPTGKAIAQCEGSVNSQEKKYRERTKYEWINGKKTKVGTEPTPVADVVNTLQKMAQKRGYVGAMIIATGASDFFTQDLEDIIDTQGEVKTDTQPTSTKTAAKPDSYKADLYAHAGFPMCCGEKMKVSKYNSDEIYCYQCKKKLPRAAMKTQVASTPPPTPTYVPPADDQTDIPF